MCSKYISRKEAANLLMVSVNTIRTMDKNGRIPCKAVYIRIKESQKKIVCYDRELFTQFAATNPVRHPGFKSEEVRLSRKTRKKNSYATECEEDVYGIKSKRDNFVYSGKAMMIILFCQPALRYGRYSYADCRD